MGRSVNSLSNSEYVIYFVNENINEYNNEDELDVTLSTMNWEDFFRNLQAEIKTKLKSYRACKKWDDREVLIFLENELCEIAISEYCELYSLSVRAKDDEFYCDANNIKEGIAKYHAQQIKKTLIKCLQNCYCKTLNKTGTFSNGEGVYEYAK